MADQMSGKSVVITGAGNGLGRATARMMAARGAIIDVCRHRG
jgi:NAD(P)-dependent dehydrogenase (short-subunit alcohol dehydrogenase family)